MYSLHICNPYLRLEFYFIEKDSSGYVERSTFERLSKKVSCKKMEIETFSEFIVSDYLDYHFSSLINFLIGDRLLAIQIEIALQRARLRF